MSEVTDFTALLAINSNQNLRWNNPADLQTGVIVTYSFATGDGVPAAGDGAYAVDSFSEFTAAQMENFRDVVGVDLVIDNSGNYDEGSYAFTTMLHELGHAMGLEHPHEGEHTLGDDDDHFENTVMTYNVGWGDYPSELGIFDVQALQYMYGEAMDTTGWVFNQTETEFEVFGNDDANTIMGVSGNNMIKGLKGADELWGRDEADTIYGGSGKDLINGMYGDDTIKGGSGYDTIYGSMEGGGEYYYDHDTIYGGKGNDKIYGQSGNDTIHGGSGDDKLYGGNHTDIINGGKDDDTIYGESGSDTLNGGSGRDTIYGGDGNDVINGGKRGDTIDGGSGSNTMTGGTGYDTFVFANADYQYWNRITDYTAGDDTLDFSGTGFQASDVVHFQNGADTYVKVGSGSDYMIAYLEDFNNADFDVDQMVF